MVHIVRRTQNISMASLIHQGETVARDLEGLKWDQDPLLLGNLKIVHGSLEGLAGSDGIVVPESVVKKLKVDSGDRILVQTQIVNGQINVVDLKIRAIYQDASGFFTPSAYLDIDTLNQLIDWPKGTYNLMGIFFDDINKTREAIRGIDASFRRLNPEADLPPVNYFEERDFQRSIEDIRRDKKFTQGQRHLLVVLQDEPFLKSFLDVLVAIQLGATVVLLFLLGIVMVGSINTCRIIVQERQREIGTMRALGMKRSDVVAVFVWEALILVTLGAAAGFLLGTLILFLLGLGEDMFFLSAIPELGFFFLKRHLAWRFNLVLMLITFAVVLGMTYLAALIPARKAGKMQPAAALRL